MPEDLVVSLLSSNRWGRKVHLGYTGDDIIHVRAEGHAIL